MKPIVIGIDTGNRCIKTAHHSFVAGLCSTQTQPTFAGETIFFSGGYHTLTDVRNPYQADKTLTSDYFVLTLFAIIKELGHRKIPPSDEPIPIVLGMGLPPSHFRRLKEAYRAYMCRGIVKLEYNKMKYRINILDVSVFAQGFSAITAIFPTVKVLKKAYIIDIGGYTTDVILVKNGVPDVSCCESLDFGMIQLTNRIARRIGNIYGHMPDETQIDDALTGENSLPANMREIIRSTAHEYTDEILRTLAEMSIDLTLAKAIFVGGGAMRLKQFVDGNAMVAMPLYISDISANAHGYEVLAAPLVRG